MQNKDYTFSVFTKPWKTESVEELASFLSKLGFDAIEFALRDGYQVEPKNAEKNLPKLAKTLKDYNLSIASVASGTEENIFAACSEAGIPIIRIMAPISLKTNFLESIDEKKKELEKLLPLCEKYNVKVAVQHHYGPGVNNSMELKYLVGDFDPKYIGAIWDTAHSALAGEEPEQALDIVWSHLAMVNFKNAYYKRVNGPEAETASWKRHFTSGRHGLASWERVSDCLKEKNYKGVICLTAEFSDEEQVNRLIAEDIQYAKSLFLK